jgi:hypothetical protein
MRAMGLPAALMFWIACLGCAQAQPWHYASPSGDANQVCSEAQPCSPQGAVLACNHHAYELCKVSFAPGVYLDPEIDIYYYRVVHLTGDCKAPQSVVLRATRQSTLIWVQDHAIGSIHCMTLDATATATAIAGRQHVIIDYDTLKFGDMLGGTHIALTDNSIASCAGTIWLTGNAHVHANVTSRSQLNLGCAIDLTNGRAFDYFTIVSDFSLLYAGGMTYSGTATGVGCSNQGGLVRPAGRTFPGSMEGNC